MSARPAKAPLRISRTRETYVPPGYFMVGKAGVLFPLPFGRRISGKAPVHRMTGLILHGDGEHDDTDALQALSDGGDVRWPDGEIADWNKLRPGRFRITGPIDLCGSDQARVA